MLVEFASAVDAVRFAVEVQTALANMRPVFRRFSREACVRPDCRASEAVL